MATTSAPGRSAEAAARPASGSPAAAARARRRAILDLVAANAVASQQQLAGLLRERGFAATQATVSRDIADLGLVKAARGDRHAYVTPGALAAGGARGTPPAGVETGAAAGPAHARLRRILADLPVSVARSGLTLVLVSRPGAASVIAQALDESPLGDEVGTLAGDNTLLVLFADEPALERWQSRFETAAAEAAEGLPAPDLTSTYP